MSGLHRWPRDAWDDADSVEGDANRYARTLDEGSTIEECDEAQVEPFRHLLPAALARRGLALEPMGPERWRVVRVRPERN